MIVNIYQACEGVKYQENEKRMEEVKKIANEAEEKGEILVVGGDMNGHVWELDGVENRNGRMVKKVAAETGLILLNSYWEGMDEPTWYQGEREYRLDYILMNTKAVEKVKKASIWEKEEIIESDHCALMVDMEIREGKERREHGRRKRGRMIKEEEWPVFRRKVEERIDELELRAALLKTAEELGTPVERRRNQEWWDDEVAEAVKKRKEGSKEARRKKKAFGEESESE